MSFKALRSKRSLVVSYVFDVVTEMEALNPITDRFMILAKGKRLNDLSVQWDEVNSECMGYNTTHSSKNEIELHDDENSRYNRLIDLGRCIVLEAEDAGKAAAPPPVVKSEPSEATVRSLLKPIEIPKLTNENYEFFISVFDTLVNDNRNLNNVIRFHYLLDAIDESAKAIIANYLPISDNNYVLAKAALKEAYSNQRRGCARHVHTLLEMPSLVQNHKPSDLADLVNTCKSAINALKSTADLDLGDFLCFEMMYSKLDKRLRSDFEKKLEKPRDIPKVDTLISFLQEAVQASELNQIASASLQGKKPASDTKPAVKQRSSLLTDSKKPVYVKCLFCSKEDHFTSQCNDLKAMSQPDRYKSIREKNLCFRCLKKHPVSACQSKYSCKKCSSADHHTLLCKQVDSKPSEAVPAVNPPAVCNSCTNSNQQALLATASVYVKNFRGGFNVLRAVLDNGSQLNLISDHAARILGLHRVHDDTTVRGIAGSKPCRGRVKVEISSRVTNYSSSVDALIMPNICNNLPSSNVSKDLVESTLQLPVADPKWGTSAPIDLLLGAQVYASVIATNDLPNKVINAELFAQYTKLGYALIGSVLSQDKAATSLFSVDPRMDELHADVKRMWELEQLPKTLCELQPQEDIAEEVYVTSTQRDDVGRYVVRLPFRSDALPLERNAYSAMRAYLKNEERLVKYPEIAKLYNQFFTDYVVSGMMVPTHEKVDYLLPHHAVFKDSTSTKVRPVFNASAKDVHGHSLNEQLLCGPSLHSDIFDVLLSFRFRPIPVVCDIRRMYNSVLVHPNDWKFQHILWRPSPEAEVQEYALTRVTFGMVPSGFLAQRTLLQLIKDEGKPYPLASQWVKNQTYVDDCLSSFSTVEEATQAKDELIALMQKGGFEVRKFASSHASVLADLSPDQCEDVDLSDKHSNVKVLGLQWSPGSDCFGYTVQNFKGKFTKRDVLSYAARIYDVKGLLTPLTTYIKCFIKRLWDCNLGWDEEFSATLAEEWTQFCSSIPKLQLLQIPRYIPVFDCLRLELLGFCDGSSVAHAASLYLRCVNGNFAEMFLIRSKGRVNPSKPLLTIPRVELQGAKLLIDLYLSVLPRLNVPIQSVTFCSDSTVVLSWLKVNPRDCQVFVGNRVSYIQANSENVQWRHIRTAYNCADAGSRGLTPDQLVDDDLWWKGPSFLLQEPPEWPDSPIDPVQLPEMKKNCSTTLLTTENDHNAHDISTPFSKLTRLQRTYAYVYRFISNVRNRIYNKLNVAQRPVLSGNLTFSEITNAFNCVIRSVQFHHMPELFTNDVVPKQYRKFTPFVDKDSGTIRVGGRLSKAPLPYAAKHPHLIPKSNLARLLCEDAHFRTIHGGQQVMRVSLLRYYRVLGLERMIKDCIFRCLTCVRYRAKPTSPMMADLPASRFTMVRPFYHTAADFCGPFLVHEGTRPRARVIKVWVCLFTCMSVRATHLEVVHEMSAEAFLAGLDRMTSRRGLMSHLFTDNGTNFTGGNTVLQEVRKMLLKSKDEIERQVAGRQIQMSFNAPLAPWKNGICERLVKILKSHLLRSVSHLTYVEFETLITRIEGVINSRPLMPISVSDEEILTPGHFLVGDNLLAVPDVDLSDVKLNHLSRWQVVRSALQYFWRCWREQYLQTLLTRCKWHESVPDLTEGTVVIVRNEQTPPYVWPMGIIAKCFPNSDGMTRVYQVRLTSGVLTRPREKLIPLPHIVEG